MQIGIVGITVVLGIVLRSSESKPLSGTHSGCGCKSLCTKSLTSTSAAHKKWEWCNVDKSCKVEGWDWCGATASLYKDASNASKGNIRQDENVKTQANKTRVSADYDLIHNGEMRSDAEQLAKTLKQLSDLKKAVTQKQRQQDQELADAQAQIRLANARRIDSEEHAKEESQKLRQHLRQAISKVGETDMAKTKVQGQLQEAKAQQAAIYRRLESTVTEKRAALEKLSAFKAAALKKQSETEQKLKEEAAEHAAAVKKLKMTKHKQHLAEKKMKEAQVGQQKAELRTFRLAVRGAVRGGTGVVKQDGKVDRWRIR